MKRCASVIIAVLVIVMSMTLPANAGSFGFGILFSAGTDRNPIKGTVLFTSRNTGETLTPNNGVVGVTEGESVRVQVSLADAKDSDRYEVKWGINTLTSELSMAEFTTNLGWVFFIDAKNLPSVSDGGRPLHLEFVDRKGSRKFVRLIAKFNYGGKDKVTESTTLFLKTVARTSDVAAQSSSDVSAAIAALKANGQKTADYATVLEKRITSLEAWAADASATRSDSRNRVGVGATSQFQIRFLQKTGPLFLRIKDPDGKVIVEEVVPGNQISYPLPNGVRYYLALDNPNDRSGYGPDYPFSVSSEKTSVVVTVRRSK